MFLWYLFVITENTCSQVPSSQPDEQTTSDSQQDDVDDDDDSDEYESNEDEELFCKRATLFYLEDDSNTKVCELDKCLGHIVKEII